MQRRASQHWTWGRGGGHYVKYDHRVNTRASRLLAWASAVHDLINWSSFFFLLRFHDSDRLFCIRACAFDTLCMSCIYACGQVCTHAWVCRCVCVNACMHSCAMRWYGMLCEVADLQRNTSRKLDMIRTRFNNPRTGKAHKNSQRSADRNIGTIRVYFTTPLSYKMASTTLRKTLPPVSAAVSNDISSPSLRQFGSLLKPVWNHSWNHSSFATLSLKPVESINILNT